LQAQVFCKACYEFGFHFSRRRLPHQLSCSIEIKAGIGYNFQHDKAANFFVSRHTLGQQLRYHLFNYFATFKITGAA
jgi:hypothetical protein